MMENNYVAKISPWWTVALLSLQFNGDYTYTCEII